MSNWLQSLEMHEILIYGLVLGIPIAVIAFSFIESTIRAVIRHRERQMMFEQGLDPDHYPEPSEVEDVPTPRFGKTDDTQPYESRRS